MIDPIKEFEASYISWLMLKRASKHLAHKDHEPNPINFKLTQDEVKWVKFRLEKEFNRMD